MRTGGWNVEPMSSPADQSNMSNPLPEMRARRSSWPCSSPSNEVNTCTPWSIGKFDASGRRGRGVVVYTHGQDADFPISRRRACDLGVTHQVMDFITQLLMVRCSERDIHEARQSQRKRLFHASQLCRRAASSTDKRGFSVSWHVFQGQRWTRDDSGFGHFRVYTVRPRPSS